MKSKKIIAYYQKLRRVADRVSDVTACYRVEKEAGFNYTDEEKKQIWEASEKFCEAEKIMRAIYEKRIGEAVVYDIHMGSWK